MLEKTVTFYHGTAAANVESIKQKGLIAGLAKGADEFAKQNHWTVAKLSKARKPSVYVTRDFHWASQFARFAAVASNDRPAVVELRVPRDEFAVRFVPDEVSKSGSGKTLNYRSEARVPPEWIAGTRLPDNPNILEELELAGISLPDFD